ncbi:MAG TPA: DUF2760 domain-containing protein [Blastocatellia bacterium]|nr:DUF2760 domain-containing protein [Blastocatellia bacterium]
MIGFGQRISYAFRTFFSILSSGEIPEDVAQELVEPPAQAAPAPLPAPAPAPQPEKPADSADRAVQMLAILQRDGRLIDFFTEDIAPYSDAQIGAAVRNLHQSCRETLERYVKLEPVIASEEGQPVTVQDPVDPAAVKLIGNVTGGPPLRGLLRHRGWRVSAVNLPPLPEGTGRSVIAPAEVEIP